MRRAAAALGAALLIAVPAAIRPTSAAVTEDNAIIDGAALAASAVAVAAADPDFDFWPVYSSSTIDNSLSHTLSAGFWPGFLLDAFAAFYGFAPYERPAAGISESQYPSEPRDSSASTTSFVRSNFALGCEFVFGPGTGNTELCREYSSAIVNPPGSLAESESHSDHLSSDGIARGTRLSLPGVIDVSEAVSRTTTRFDRALGKTVVEASFTARDVTLADMVHIDKITATSTAIAGGTRETSSASSKFTIVGARSGDSVVVIDDQGMHIQGDAGFDQLNAAFAGQGLEVRLVQGRQEVLDGGERAQSTTGGLKIRMFRQRAEEAFPALLSFPQRRQALCDAAERSLPNQEITRIEQRFANPLFGAPIPIVPKEAVPKEVVVSQSVPPPVSCPFLNRDMEIALVLGRTDAAARLTPVPEIPLFDFSADQPVAVAALTDEVPVLEPTFLDEPAPVETSVLGSGLTAPRQRAGGPAPLFQPRPVASERDIAGGVKSVYGGMGLVALLGMGAPFMLRRLSAL